MGLVIGGLVGLAAHAASAQDWHSWPDRPVHIVVPLTAGSATGVMARMVAKQLGEQLGQPFIVEYKPGAGGTIVLHGDADHLSQHAVRHAARPDGRGRAGGV